MSLVIQTHPPQLYCFELDELLLFLFRSGLPFADFGSLSGRFCFG